MKIEIDLSAATDEQLEAYSENLDSVLSSIDNVSEITTSLRNVMLLELQSRGRVESIGKPVVPINHPAFISVSE